MIEIKNVHKTYSLGKTEVYALRGVSVTIEPGEFVAIMGPSGSGKSTLLHLLGFLDHPDSGEYKYFGEDVTHLPEDELARLRNHMAGFVFQQFYLLSRMNAVQNVQLPLIYAGKKEFISRASEKLAIVGLEKRQGHKSNELSGGEQQRVAIARALINDPLVIFADEPTGNLDTKSEEEIMDVLQKLNAEGKTIIMVTHEKEVAEYASRIIMMRDGQIVSDEKKRNIVSPKNLDKAKTFMSVLKAKHSSFGKIEFLDHIGQSLYAIFSNKMRSLLSMLGIMIGVAAVIAMLALGEGAKESISQRLASLGSNLLVIRSGAHNVRGVSTEAGAVTRFNVSDITALSKIPSITKSSGLVRGSAQLVFQNKNWRTSVQGVGLDYASMTASMPPYGRWITEQELRTKDKVAVIGMTPATQLFGDQDPIGQMIKINRINFRVIGILPQKGADVFHDQDDIVMIPLSTAMDRVLGKQYVDQIYLEARDPALMATAQEEIKDLIVNRHRLKQKAEDSFEIRDMSEIQETLKQTTQTMSLLLGCIAGISLLVGGIGIMNIMLVSVTERTKEIGLRKAIGANGRDIMFQFLVESIVMTFAGGLIGVALGVLIALSLSTFMQWSTKISSYSIILATTFSMATGLIFGLWPASRASKMNPIEALRFE